MATAYAMVLLAWLALYIASCLDSQALHGKVKQTLPEHPTGLSTRERSLYARDALSRQNGDGVDLDRPGAIIREVETRLFDHLDPVRVTPTRALTIGADSADFRRTLKKRFDAVQWVQLAPSLAYLQPSQPRWPWQRRQASRSWPHQLPFRNASFGLVVSNLLCSDPLWLPDAVAEIARSLVDDGLVALSLLGPASFQEFSNAWKEVDNHTHTSPFADMHDVGDMLVYQGFTGVVMDSERLTITYPSVADAVAEMRNLGLGNHLRGRPNALITPRTWQRVIESYPRVNDTIPVTLELVYAHAWRGPSKNTATVKLELP